MRRLAIGFGVLALAGCAAMAPPAAGPWPPLPPRAAPAAAAPSVAAGPPSPQATPAPALVEPLAAAPTLQEAARPPRMAPAALFAMPAGWRTPSDMDIAGPNLVRRGDSPALYLAATGDYNGDGAEDRAALLVSDDRGQYGVFIFDGRPEAYPVLVGGPLAAVGAFGVETLHVPAAGPDRLRFFLFGSSRFLIRWDGAAYAVSVESD